MRTQRKRNGRILVVGLFLLLLILLVGVAAGVAFYLFWPMGEKVSALIRVARGTESIVYETKPISVEEYEIFKNTQMELIKSPYVFMAALRKKHIANLSIVMQEEDPMSWLEDELEVEYLDNSEIMSVSFTSNKPKEAAELVNAIVDAYIDEVVNKHERERRAMSAQLTQIFNSKENEVRSKRASLINLSEKLGVTAEGTPNVEMQLNMQKHSTYLEKLLRAQYDLQKAIVSQKMNQAILDEIDKKKTSNSESIVPAKSKSKTPDEYSDISVMLKQLDNIITQSDTARLPKKLQADLKDLHQQFNTWHARLLDKRRSDVLANIKNLEQQIAVLSEQTEFFKNEVAQCEEVAEQASRSSVDIAMMRQEMEYLDESLRKIAATRERLDIESRSRPRIIREQEACPPENKIP